MITSSITTLQECPVNLQALHEAVKQVQVDSERPAGLLSALAEQQTQAIKIKFEGNTWLWLMRKCQAPIWTWVKSLHIVNRTKETGEVRACQSHKKRLMPSWASSNYWLCSAGQENTEKMRDASKLIWCSVAQVQRTSFSGGEAEHPWHCTTCLIVIWALWLAGSGATAQSLSQLFPHPVGMFSAWATACRQEKCGSCTHKPICVLVPNLTVHMWY